MDGDAVSFPCTLHVTGARLRLSGGACGPVVLSIDKRGRMQVVMIHHLGQGFENLTRSKICIQSSSDCR